MSSPWLPSHHLSFRLAVEKLKTMDAAFRQQLDAKEFGHNEALGRLSQEKQEEIEAANHRVRTRGARHLAQPRTPTGGADVSIAHKI